MVKGQPEVSAMLRFKAAGIDDDLGKLHDLTCPAYHPDEVAKYHPFADFSTVIDERAWMRKALAAASGPTDVAKAATQMWNSVAILKAADPGMLNDFRLAAYKAFRDANPGPATYPTPGSVSPMRYYRPLVTDGHEASSPGHDGPNSSPGGGLLGAERALVRPAPARRRPPVTQPQSHEAGRRRIPRHPGRPGAAPVRPHGERPGPHGTRPGPRPAVPPVPRSVPPGLPGLPAAPLPAAEGHPVPAVAGIGKGEDAERRRSTKSADPGGSSPAPVAAVSKAPAEVDGQFMDADVYKGFKKMRKKLGKKVLSGKMTVDEARSRMGRQFAQKAAEPAEAAVAEVGSVAAPSRPDRQPEPRDRATYHGLLTPDLIKAAVAEALRAQSVPLEAVTVGNVGADPEVIKAAVAEALAPVMEQFHTKLAEQQRVIDAIADQPDPATAAFSGLAYRPALTKAARPAGVTEIAESHAAQARQLVRQELENTYYTHSDPAAREAAAQAIARLGSGGHTMT